MTEKNRELLEAHVQFELARFDEARMEATLREEIGEVYDGLAETRVKDLFIRDQAVRFIKEEILAVPPTEAFVAFVRDGAQRLHEELMKSEIPADGFVDDEVQDSAIRLALQAQDLRRYAVQRLTHSAMFAHVVTDIVYAGISEFMRENFVSKNIPGAAALFKFGQNLLNQAGFGESSERMIKDFIKNNTDEILKRSETIIMDSMSEDFMRRLGEELRADFSKRTVGEFARFLNQMDEKDIAALVLRFWKNLSSSELAPTMAESFVDWVLNNHGEKNTAQLLTEFGWDKERSVSRITALALPITRAAREKGYLEKSTRRRLEAFYNSDAAKAVIG